MKRGVRCSIVLPGLLWAAAAPAQIWQEVVVPMTDGVNLDATIVTPLGLPPSDGFPTLILIHGLDSDKLTMYPLAAGMATYGYASVCYTVRGHGNSGGLSTLDGPREVQDLREMISYERSRPRLNREAQAVVGGSQGRIHGWTAAVHRMPGARTVVPMLATPGFAERDLAPLVDSIRIPVYQGLDWNDILFFVNGGIRARARMAAYGVPVWSFFGSNGHGAPFDPLEVQRFVQSAVQRCSVAPHPRSIR